MQKKYCFFMLTLAWCFFCGSFVFSDSRSLSGLEGNVQMGVFFLKDEGIMEVNLEDSDVLLQWTKDTHKEIKNILVQQTDPMDVLIQVNLYKGSSADITLSSRPAISQELKKQIRSHLDESCLPRTKIVDFSFQILYRVGGGASSKEMSFEPQISNPYQTVLSDYKAASIKGKLGILKNWSKKEVLPVLSAFCRKADEPFDGVRQIARMLEDLEYWRRLDVEKITYENEAFWNALQEMASGNQLVSSVLIFLFVANEELDKARRLLTVVLPFAADGYVPSSYLKELDWRLKVFYEDVHEEIQKGIDLHETKRYDEALNIYKNLLQNYPFSAWGYYEIFYTIQMQHMTLKKKGEEEQYAWDKYKSRIYNCDPLYPAQFKAETQEEMFQLAQRMEMKTLFQDSETQLEDVVKYADIALNLRSYGFAALLYQYILLSFEREVSGERDVLAHFLYCLEKLGVTQIKSRFKGDFERKFKKIQKAREELMKKYPA